MGTLMEYPDSLYLTGLPNPEYFSFRIDNPPSFSVFPIPALGGRRTCLQFDVMTMMEVDL